MLVAKSSPGKINNLMITGKRLKYLIPFFPLGFHKQVVLSSYRQLSKTVRQSFSMQRIEGRVQIFAELFLSQPGAQFLGPFHVLI